MGDFLQHFTNQLVHSVEITLILFVSVMSGTVMSDGIHRRNLVSNDSNDKINDKYRRSDDIIEADIFNKIYFTSI